MKKYIGVTLIEVLLVLAIGAAFIVFGINQYGIYRQDLEVQRLQYNIDTLFQAMALYYKANCYGITTSTGIVQPGTLNPASDPPNPFPIDINVDLRTRGYFTSTFLPNTLVADNGYIVQFNRYTQPRRICTAGTNATGPDDPACTSTAVIGTIVMWTAQVAILLQDTTNLETYTKLLNADCVSGSASDKTVFACDKHVLGNYLVWERMPSFAASTIKSDYWLTNPTLEQFKQMYTTYPINYLLGTKPNTGYTPSDQQQYFLCGS